MLIVLLHHPSMLLAALVCALAARAVLDLVPSGVDRAHGVPVSMATYAPSGALSLTFTGAEPPWLPPSQSVGRLPPTAYALCSGSGRHLQVRFCGPDEVCMSEGDSGSFRSEVARSRAVHTEDGWQFTVALEPADLPCKMWATTKDLRLTDGPSLHHGYEKGTLLLQ